VYYEVMRYSTPPPGTIRSAWDSGWAHTLGVGNTRARGSSDTCRDPKSRKSDNFQLTATSRFSSVKFHPCRS